MVFIIPWKLNLMSMCKKLIFQSIQGQFQNPEFKNLIPGYSPCPFKNKQPQMEQSDWSIATSHVELVGFVTDTS